MQRNRQNLVIDKLLNFIMKDKGFKDKSALLQIITEGKEVRPQESQDSLIDSNIFQNQSVNDGELSSNRIDPLRPLPHSQSAVMPEPDVTPKSHSRKQKSRKLVRDTPSEGRKSRPRSSKGNRKSQEMQKRVRH